MGIIWATFIIMVAATWAIRSVLMAIRQQEKELPILDRPDLAQGVGDTSK